MTSVVIGPQTEIIKESSLTPNSLKNEVTNQVASIVKILRNVSEFSMLKNFIQGS